MLFVMRCIIVILIGCIMMISMNAAMAQGENIAGLMKLISSNEISSMNCEDLAILFTSNNYNAIPRDGYVELNLGGTIFMFTPNGNKPGLCEIEMVIKQCPNTMMYEVDRTIS